MTLTKLAAGGRATQQTENTLAAYRSGKGTNRPLSVTDAIQYGDLALAERIQSETELLEENARLKFFVDELLDPGAYWGDYSASEITEELHRLWRERKARLTKEDSP